MVKIKQLVLILVICMLTFALIRSRAQNVQRHGTIRDIPYPYRSMLAICSDIDGTTVREFELYHQFLNTDQHTKFGAGLGLDIADSFWMYALGNDGVIHDYDGSKTDNVMSYYNGTGESLKYAGKILKYYEAGWIDSIHSYGDFSQIDTSMPIYKDEYGKKASNEMVAENLLPSVWINHGNEANVQNMRKTSLNNLHNSYQAGSDPKSPYYHADYTIPNGIKFVWFSMPDNSFSTYSPIYPVKLQDGQSVWGFKRYTGEGKSTFHKYNWSIYDVHEQLSEANLNKLVASGDISVVAQHLGGSGGDYTFTSDAIEAFQRLEKYYRQEDILVARTSRTLEYARIRDNLEFDYTPPATSKSGEIIDIKLIDDPVLGASVPTEEQLKGINFNVKYADSAVVSINGVPVSEKLLFRGVPSGSLQTIGFKWYEEDITDYSAEFAIENSDNQQ